MKQSSIGKTILGTAILACASLGVCILLISGLSLFTMNLIGVEIEEIVEVKLPLIKSTTELVELKLEQSIELAKYDAERTEAHIEAFWALGEKVGKKIKESEKILKDGERFAIDAESLADMKETERQFEAIEEEFKEYSEHATTLFALAGQKTNAEEFTTKLRALEKEGHNVDVHIEELLKTIEEKTIATGKLVEGHEQSAIKWIAGLAAFATLLGIFFGFYTQRKVLGALGKLVDEIFDASSGVSVAASQLSEGSQNVSSTTSESAASLEETASAVEEFSSVVKLSSENTEAANRLAAESCASAQSGEQEINELIKSMHEISESSAKIEDIIKVIDDIAFQTNLLALNAAVEAARAGDQGKGFAVVAEAVRNLAQRSAESAKEIASLIKDNAEKAEGGVKVADRGGKILRDIVTKISEAAGLVNDVSTASLEQSRGIEQINASIAQIQQATQRNAAVCEEFAASSEELSAQSESLRQLVVQLDVAKKLQNKNGPSTSSGRPNAPGAPTTNLASNVIPLDDEERSRLQDVSGF